MLAKRRVAMLKCAGQQHKKNYIQGKPRNLKPPTGHLQRKRHSTWGRKIIGRANLNIKVFTLFSLTFAKTSSIYFIVCMNGMQIKMQLDTGASVSHQWRKVQEAALYKKPAGSSSRALNLHIQLMGRLPVKVSYGNEEVDLWYK